MRSPKTHERALRAALQVARGNRRQAASALTGLTMLATGPGCGDSATTSNTGHDSTSTNPETSAGDTAGRTANDAVQRLLDQVSETSEPAGDTGPTTEITSPPDTVAGADVVTSPDTVTSPDITPAPDTTPAADATTGADVTAVTDATNPQDDAAAMDAHMGADTTATMDAMPSGDADEDCLAHCWQPNGTVCVEHVDCNVEEVMGTCADSTDPCKWATDCDASGTVACEGYQPPVEAPIDPNTGDIYEYSTEVKCIDGICHEGDSISAEAQNCCGWGAGAIEAWPLCEGLMPPVGGCTPWGPPAPPAFDGVSLAERTRRWLA